jgi:D-threo-aldose 1-dehydrogenase
MDPLEQRQVGSTDWKVTVLGFGAATIADRLSAIPEAQAQATLEAAWGGGIGYFDTSPFYGHGKSELRLGHMLRGHPRETFSVSTKVGRVFSRPANLERFELGGWKGGLPFEFRRDYTRSGVLRSYEDSLTRLGLPRVEALLIHDLDRRSVSDPEQFERHFRELEEGGGFEALRELREAGEIRAIGAGVNHAGIVRYYLDRFPLDFFILAMPFTLLNQDALDDDLPLCVERGVGVVIGAPFASGILVRGPESGEYGYRAPDPEIAEKTRRIAAVCERHGTPLAAAALQFPLRHPAVAAVIPGPNAPEQVRQNLQLMRHPTPPALWEELAAEGLIRTSAA